MTLRDSNGQPFNPDYNYTHRLRRTISEVIGLAKGLLMDGVVSEAEAEGLAAWVLRNREFVVVWPLDTLAERLDRILTDGKIDQDECAELKELLERLVGPDSPDMLEANAATRLPVTQPPPVILFPDRVFVFTGKFIYGTRR